MTFQAHEGYHNPNPTQEDLEAAKSIALRMAGTVPEGVNSAVLMAAIGMLCQVSFQRCIKKQYVVKAFEDWAFFTRRNLVQEVRDAKD